MDIQPHPHINEPHPPLSPQISPPPSRFSFLQTEDEKTIGSLSQLVKWFVLPRISQTLFDENLDYYKQVGYSGSAALISNIFLRNVFEMGKEPEDQQPALEIVNRAMKACLFSNYMLAVSGQAFSYTGSFVDFSAASLEVESNLAYYPLALITGAPALLTVALSAIALNNIIASTGVFNRVFDTIDFITQTTLPIEVDYQEKPPELDEITLKLILKET